MRRLRPLEPPLAGGGLQANYRGRRISGLPGPFSCPAAPFSTPRRFPRNRRRGRGAHRPAPAAGTSGRGHRAGPRARSSLPSYSPRTSRRRLRRGRRTARRHSPGSAATQTCISDRGRLHRRQPSSRRAGLAPPAHRSAAAHGSGSGLRLGDRRGGGSGTPRGSLTTSRCGRSATQRRRHHVPAPLRGSASSSQPAASAMISFE